MQRIRRWSHVLGVTAVVWAAAIPTAARVTAQQPLGRASRTMGTVVYLAGAVVCHQKPERSFHNGARAFPVCARCTGIYGGAAAVAAILLAGAAPRSFRAETRIAPAFLRRLVLAAILPTAATLAWEWVTGAPTSNLARAVAGLPLGAIVMWVLMRAAQAE